MNLLPQEKETLCRLVTRYGEIASLSIQKEKIQLWKALNRGEMIRPMVLIDQIPWHEMNLNDELTLTIQEPYFRRLEQNLRQTIYKWEHMPADMVVEPFIRIPKLINSTGYGLCSNSDKLHLDENSNIVSQHFHNQFQESEDAEKIKNPEITYDEKTSLAYLEIAKSTFGHILPVYLAGMQFHLGIWDSLSMYMGLEDIYYDIIDRPEFIHDLVNRMYASLTYGIQKADELKLHDDQSSLCHCSHIYTDEFLPEPGAGKGSTANHCWAFGLAQLFSSVAPEVSQEFELDYFKKVAPLFGGIYYGCCERLDDRLEYILKIPNIRKISCSPWSDRNVFAEKIGKSVVMSSKPNPSLLAFESFDFAAAKADFSQTLTAAKAQRVNLEFILKDISTLHYQPERLFQWEKMAMELVNR